MEELHEASTLHSITINIRQLMGEHLDITGLEERGGGLIAYRIEIYNPVEATTYLYNRRFEFYGMKTFPTVIEGPFVDLITETSATFSWDTDRPAYGTVYVDNRPYRSPEDSLTAHFELSVTDLQPGHTYHYRVEVTDGTDTTVTREYRFHTPEHNSTSFRFAVMGDSRAGFGGGEVAFGGTNYQVMSRLSMDAFHRRAEFIIHTGDMINGHTTSVLDFEMQLEAYKDAIEPVGHYIPIYEVIGNHEVVMDLYDDDNRGIKFDKCGDVSSEAIFAREFVNPINAPVSQIAGAPTYNETVYTFDYGNCRFIVMNNTYWYATNPEQYGGNLEGYVLDDQMEWLNRRFAEAEMDPSIEHIFLYSHEPMFPNGGHLHDAMWYNGGDPDRNSGWDRHYIIERRNEIWEAFVRTGKAVAAIFGHEHHYCRTLITSAIHPSFTNPVWQIVSGGAGGPYYARSSDVPWAEYTEAFSTQSHYTLFAIEGGRVTLEVYSLTGELIDEAMLKE